MIGLGLQEVTVGGKVVHFEVPFDDAERALAFYRDVFGWQITSMPEMRYNLVSTGPAGEDGGPTEPGYIGGGMLSRGPQAQPRYAYRDTPEAVRDAVRAMAAICASYDVPLRAAALQFSLRDPRVVSTVVGISAPERVAETVELAALDIPPAMWEELDAVVPPPGYWLE